MTEIIGLIMIYAVIHFGFIQQKAYKNRTQYEKVVTWIAMISVGLVFMGIINS